MLSDKILSTALQNLAEYDDKLEAATRLKRICEDFNKNEKNFMDDYDAENFLWSLLDPLDFARSYRNKRYVDGKLSQLKWFLAGGISLEDYENRVRQYNDAVLCGLVWTQNYLAYRCRTCGNTPSMSLCTDCFLGGQHDGHDFSMFRSQAGGACDCGDERVMREGGRHGPSALKKKRKAPEELFLTVDVVLPHVIRCILCLFSASFTCPFEDDETMDDPSDAVKPAEELLSLLQTLSEYGAAMKERLSDILLDKKSYIDFDSGVSHFKDKSELLLKMRANYKKFAIPSVESICSIEDGDILDCPMACPDLVHDSYLAELVFWLVKLRLPQQMVTFLLSLLPCEKYKASFVHVFVMHYTRIAFLLLNEPLISPLNNFHADSTSNRVIHISVQLVSNDKIAAYMVNELKFTRLLVASLYNTIKRSLVECTLNTSTDNFHLVANCRNRIMENQVYWVTVHDFRNCLGHKEVALDFLRDPSLLDLFCCLVSTFQGMNTNVRRLIDHEEQENRAHYAAFMAEFEICSMVCRELVQHLTDQDSYDCILSMIQNVTCHLQEWFEAIQFSPPQCWKPPLLECSFHFPLHRTWASFICQAYGLNMQINLPCETFLRQLLMHPLILQVARSEIQCDMWVRNSASPRYQSYYYGHTQFALIDVDIYLLQVCACRVNPDWLILTMFERFHLVDWLSFDPAEPAALFHRSEWNMPMLEGCLRLLALLLTNRIHLGMDDDDCLKLEIATLLCQNDCTHSQIVGSLANHRSSNRSSFAEKVEKMLNELADYVAPQEAGGNMSQGVYIIKDSSWETHFDPLFLAFRCTHPRDFQTVMDRYRKRLDARRKIDKKYKSIWPPYKFPSGKILPVYDGLKRLLNAKSLHAIIFAVLFKALNGENNVSDCALSLAIFLLELIVDESAQKAADLSKILQPINNSSRPTVIDLLFCGWFTSNCIFENFCHKIDRILCIDNVPGLSRSCQNDAEHGDFPDLIHLRSRHEPHFQGDPTQTHTDQQLALVSSTDLTVSRPTSSFDLPFIDSSMEIDLTYEEPEADFFYKKAIAILPLNLRRRFSLMPACDRTPLDVAAWTIAEEACDVGFEESPCESVGPPSSAPLALEHQLRLAIEGPPISAVIAAGRANNTAALVPMQPLPTENLADRPTTAETTNQNSPIAVRCQRPSALPRPSISIVDVRHSLGSLLIALHDKLSAATRGEPSSGALKSQLFHSPALSKDGAASSDVSTGTPSDEWPADGASRIVRLLRTVCAYGGETCRRHIDVVCEMSTAKRQRTASTSNGGRQDPSCDDRSRSTNNDAASAVAKKHLSKERQQRLMAQFKAGQKNVFEKLISTESARLSTAGVPPKMPGPQRISKPDSPESRSQILKLADSEYEMDSHNAVQCVICNCPASASAEYPLGLIVSVKSTGMLAQQCLDDQLKSNDSDQLIDFDDGLNEFSARFTRSKYEEEFLNVRITKYSQTLLAHDFNWLWNSTVYVQTCGHYVHSDCHETYMASLKADAQRTRTFVLQVDRGEISCPLCRRFSNALMPIVPSRAVQSQFESRPAGGGSFSEASCDKSIEEIWQMLNSAEEAPKSTKSKLDLMIKSFVTSFRSRFSSKQSMPPCESILLHNIIQSNVEILSLMKQCDVELARSCIVEFCSLVTFYTPDPVTEWAGEPCAPVPNDPTVTWARLTGFQGQNFTVKNLLPVDGQKVPLLYGDPGATLTHFCLLFIRLRTPVRYFNVMIASLLSLVSIQICANEVSNLPKKLLLNFSAGPPISSMDVAKNRDILTLFRYLCQKIHATKFDRIENIDSADVTMADAECSEYSGNDAYFREVPVEVGQECTGTFSSTLQRQSEVTRSTSKFDEQSEPAFYASFVDSEASDAWPSIENKIYARHAPFLRMAALFKLCTYGDACLQLEEGVGFVDDGVVERSITCAIGRRQFDDVDWLKMFTTGRVAKSDWLTLHTKWGPRVLKDMLEEAGFEGADRLESELIFNWLPWSKPRLLPLPKFYDVLFRKLYKRPCPQCNSVPSESLLCMLCGRLLCNGNICCVEGFGSLTEAQMHSTECGAGLGIFLSVHTASVLIVERSRDAVWGSPYLDAHGEEDRGLKRGKPLMLSPERMALLERQYFSHSFDDACKRWQWINRYNPNRANVIAL